MEKVDPRLKIAFPVLSAMEIEALEPFGKNIRLDKGAEVWKAGKQQICMSIVKKGTMEIVDGRSKTHITNHTKGQFSGDIDVLSGRPALVTAIAKTDLELLQIPGDCVRSIVGEIPNWGHDSASLPHASRASAGDGSGRAPDRGISL